MTSIRRLTGALGIAAVTCAITAVGAYASEMASLQRDSRQYINLGQYTLAPFAFTRFCIENPSDCLSAPAARVSWTSTARRAVAEVNRRVNREITPVNDVTDTWDVDVTAGDCEDYALTKRRALLAMGIPTSALRIATAITPNGVGHAVLVVSTTKGDFVLDNRDSELRLWRETDLRFLKIASAANPDIWQNVEMDGPQFVVLASN